MYTVYIAERIFAGLLQRSARKYLEFTGIYISPVKNGYFTGEMLFLTPN